MKKIELIRAVIELTADGILNKQEAYNIVEKIINREKLKEEKEKETEYLKQIHELGG